MNDDMEGVARPWPTKAIDRAVVAYRNRADLAQKSGFTSMSTDLNERAEAIENLQSDLTALRAQLAEANDRATKAGTSFEAMDLRAQLTAALADVARLKEERDMKIAEIEMLRGVGCCEDGDGPCGVCIKCLRSQLTAAAAREAALVEALKWVSTEYGFLHGKLSEPTCNRVRAALARCSPPAAETET